MRTTPSIELHSYGGRQSADARVVVPTSIDALRRHILEANSSGRQLAFRGSGGSLHDQALHDDLVVCTPEMPRIGTVVGDSLHATAALHTGKALALARESGWLPPVLPTSSRLSLGGVLASDTLSRASMAWGKFSSTVRSIDVIVGDGTSITARRDAAPGTLEHRLFRALPGSLGGLAYVSAMELDLMRLPGPGARVESEPQPFSSFEGAVDSMVLDFAARPEHPDASSPLTWFVLTDRGGAISFRSRYVAEDRPLAPLAVHQPHSRLNRLGHLAAALPGWTEFGARALARSAAAHKGAYVDTLEGFTFMMDGNWAMRDSLARLGLDVWVLQQSFVIPVVPGDDPGRAIKAFVGSALDEGPRHGVSTSVMDVLMAPSDGALLSSTRHAAGAVVSLAYMGLGPAKHQRVVDTFRALARRSADLGGRVHLAKHAHAEPDVLQSMYGPALDEYAALKDEVDPRGVFGGRLIRRLLAGR